MMEKEFYLKIYGCKVNHYYAELVRSSLLESGYNQRNQPGCLNIIYACSVTGIAEKQSVISIKKLAKSGEVKVGGCLNNTANDGKSILNELDISIQDYPTARMRARPTVLVQTGCQRFCSYCKVNLMRGCPRQRSELEILTEVQYLEQRGFNEVVLTGISLGCYQPGIFSLLEFLINNTSSVRFRLGSVSPRDIIENQDKLDLFSNSRVCPHLHLSLQSGSEEVLKEMNRNYSPREVEESVKYLRSVSPVTLGLDIICGFPTETELNFRETVDFLEKIQPSYLHVFPFSYRTGTLAGLLKDRVGKVERVKRAEKIRNRGRIFKSNFFKNNLNRELAVVIETSEKNLMIGTSGNYIKVRILNQPGENKLRQLVRVKITGKDSKYLIGNIIES